MCLNASSLAADVSLARSAHSRMLVLGVSLCLLAGGSLLVVLGVFVRQRVAALTEANSRLRASMAALKAMQAEVIEASRHAGRAEVATTVLHNVGNVLTSVNVSAEVVHGIVARSTTQQGLERAARMLNDHAADLPAFFTEDEKGRRLPLYLTKLDEAAQSERAQLLDELTSLQHNVEHIRAIVERQQAYARPNQTAAAPTVLEGLVADALALSLVAAPRHQKLEGDTAKDAPVEVVTILDPTLIHVTLDRHEAVQILTNLLSNARHAVRDARPARITVRTLRPDANTWSIEVADTGCGIAADNLPRIFQHGFTTKADGHGFGLHGAALAAKALGGSLSASSPGPGQGAVFRLVLPITPPVRFG